MFVELLAASIILTQASWFRANRTVVCGPFDEIVKGLASAEFKENPVWLGSSGDTRMVLLVNADKTSWTLVHYVGGTGCVVGAGETSLRLIDNSGPKTPTDYFVQ